jgi:hypothetical protein
MGSPAVETLTEAFHSSPCTFHATVTRYLKLEHDRFLPDPRQFIYDPKSENNRHAKVYLMFFIPHYALSVSSVKRSSLGGMYENNEHVHSLAEIIKLCETYIKVKRNTLDWFRLKFYCHILVCTYMSR